MRFPIKIGLPGSNRRLFDAMKNGIIRDPISGSYWWSQRIRRRDFTGAAATSQTLTLSTLYPNNVFPTYAIRKSVLLYVATSMAGPSISNATIIVGDALDPNGVLEATAGDIFLNDGAVIQDTGAAEFAERAEPGWDATLGAGTGWDPTVGIVTTGANISVATAFEVKLMVEFSPILFLT